jgi:hypothetical protein
MSISGVSSFATVPSRDVRAEFERLRELHSKGPEGYQRRRVNGQEDSEPHPSAAAEALAGTSPGDAARSARPAGKVDFSV